jgi:hypothetical protein
MLPTKFRFIWPNGFRGEDFKKSANQKQELPMVAMFVNGSGQNEQSLERTFHRCFLPSFTSFGWGVSEQKIKMWKVNGRRTPSDGKSSHCLWQGELKRYKGSNTGKRARRKNLRHPREIFLVSNEAPPSWRPIEIFPVGVWEFSVLPSYRCLILFLTKILLKVQYIPSWDTPYMKYDVTHILTSLKNDVKGTEKDI